MDRDEFPPRRPCDVEMRPAGGAYRVETLSEKARARLDGGPVAADEAAALVDAAVRAGLVVRVL